MRKQILIFYNPEGGEEDSKTFFTKYISVPWPNLRLEIQIILRFQFILHEKGYVLLSSPKDG